MKPVVRRRFRRTVFASRGASLIEIMISMAVIAVSALAAASFFSQQLKTARNLTRGSSCKVALDSQLSYIRQMTAVAPGYDWDGKDSASPGTAKNIQVLPNGQGDPWLADSARLAEPRARDIVGGIPGGAGVGARELNTHLLQKGSMGFLAALYNTVPNISSGVDFSTIDRRNPGVILPSEIDTENLKDFNATIAIRTFNPGSGDDQSSGTRTWIRPQGALSDTQLAASGVAQFPANTTSHFGYRVVLTGTYTDPTGEQKRCTASEDFLYPIDLEAPKIAVVLNAFDSNTDRGSLEPFNLAMQDPRNRPECSHDATARQSARVRLEIGFKSTVGAHDRLDSGTIYMCRDQSEQMNPDYCRNAPGASMNGQPTAGTNPPWVPCNEATVCGMRAANVRFVRDNPGEVRYVLDYDQSTSTSTDGLWGCDIKMDVATVDPAGNFKLLTSEAYPNPRVRTTAAGGKYFQAAPCWACYKKKPFSFLTIALVIGAGALIAATGGAAAIAAASAVGGGFAAGGVIACATGVGGACRVKGYNFKRNSCNVPSGYSTRYGATRYCKKVTPRYPPWFVAGGTPGQSCEARNGTYPGTTQRYTFPATDDGGYGSAEYYDLPNGRTCNASATCVNGTWTQLDGEPAIESCNTLRTAYTMDSNFGNDQKVCIMEVPNGSPTRFQNKAYYTSFFTSTCSEITASARCHVHSPRRNRTVCTGPGCVDNDSNDDTCRGQDVDPGDYCHEYPLDGLNGTQLTVGPTYYYFEPFNPSADSNLGFCGTPPETGD